jgi:NADH dehydrogenase
MANLSPAFLRWRWHGWHSAKVITARLADRPAPPFAIDKGTMATSARRRRGGFRHRTILRPRGLVTWLFVHLLYLVGYRNRVLVAIQWFFQYSTFNRGARLITRPLSRRD